jgi:hypothetical protein
MQPSHMQVRLPWVIERKNSQLTVAMEPMYYGFHKCTNEQCFIIAMLGRGILANL